MPKFTKQKKEKKQPRGVIPQEVIDEYKGFIEQTDKEDVGTLEFEEGEDIKLGRKALVEAGVQSRKYVKVRKPRGAENSLLFERITKKEFDEAKDKAEARAEKLRGKQRAKKAKTKAKKKS